VPGGQYTIQYISGTTSSGGIFTSFYDANGNPGYVTNMNGGTSDNHFPSYYFNPATYPTYLAELVGTFADSSGDIVGTPFPIGDLATVTAPAGATQLQLGINDDIYHDNSGSLQIQVSAVPEPSSFILLGVVAAFGFIAYRWRRRASVPA
jgi:hypothetical protein